LLDTDAGTEQVVELLDRIEYGGVQITNLQTQVCRHRTLGEETNE
jgi:hypothetical protein